MCSLAILRHVRLGYVVHPQASAYLGSFLCFLVRTPTNLTSKRPYRYAKLYIESSIYHSTSGCPFTLFQSKFTLCVTIVCSPNSSLTTLATHVTFRGLQSSVSCPLETFHRNVRSVNGTISFKRHNVRSKSLAVSRYHQNVRALVVSVRTAR